MNCLANSRTFRGAQLSNLQVSNYDVIISFKGMNETFCSSSTDFWRTNAAGCYWSLGINDTHKHHLHNTHLCLLVNSHHSLSAGTFIWSASFQFGEAWNSVWLSGHTHTYVCVSSVLECTKMKTWVLGIQEWEASQKPTHLNPHVHSHPHAGVE